MSTISLNEMPLNEVKQYILPNVKLQCAKSTTARMCIIGSPGCGKSDIMRQICEEKGWGLAVKYLSNMSMEQITGIPCQVKDGEHARWTKPEIFNFDDLDYRPKDYVEGKSVTVLLIDDFHLADKIIQKYLFQLLTYKSLNGYKLPENTAIIMAGNKITDKALAHSIPAPVMNRISVYEVKADPKDWIKNYAFAHDVRDDIISFINSRGEQYFSQTPIESTPWASPRSWTFLSEQMNAYEEEYGSLPIDKLSIIANSLIGTEFASEFIAYREIFAKWNIDNMRKMKEETLKSTISKEVSKNPVNAYAVINSTMAWMISKTKELGFDVKNPEVKKITKFAYDLMTIVLGIKCNGVQIKPLIVAGTNYMYMYDQAMSKNYRLNEKFREVRLQFLTNLEQQRDIDWIYYSIIAGIFDMDISDDDAKHIAEAEANLRI